MQNKPNLPHTQMNVNKVLTKDYENVHLFGRAENKPNLSRRSRIKTNYQSAVHRTPDGGCLMAEIPDTSHQRPVTASLTRTASRYKPRLQNKLQTKIWPVCTRGAIRLHRSATAVTDSNGMVPTAILAAVNSSMIQQLSLS